MNSYISLSLLLLTSTLAAAEPHWIWSTKDAATKAEKGSAYFRKAFNLDEPESGTAEVAADDAFELFLNGRSLGTGDTASKRYRFNLTPRLLPGRNVLAIAAVNGAPSPAGVAAKFSVKAKGKDEITIVTDQTWKFSLRPQGTWTRIESDDSTWETAVAVGEYGQTAPWGKAGDLVEGITGPAILNKPRSREKGLFEFRDGDRVVFLGSGFIERLQNTGYLETMLTAAMPTKNITFRNLGWSGDTVWGDARVVFGSRADGFQRLLSDVSMCNPTVLIVCYGENEAYAGEAGLKDFRTGLNTLLDSLEATGARIVLLGPRQHEKLKPPLPDPAKYNADLRKYNDVIGQAAKEREHTFVDFFDAKLFDDGEFILTENGIHLSSAGDAYVSRYMARSLGAPFRPRRMIIDINSKTYDASHVVLTEIEFKPPRVAFEISTHHEFGDEVESPTLTFWNLPEGDYELFVDGRKNSAREENFFSFPRTYKINDRGNRTEEMRQVINAKNSLFFHRYRPQNETYLLLFRKHEQGNNAAEIPQFDPLIAELEKKIAELKQLVKQKYELVKVK